MNVISNNVNGFEIINFIKKNIDVFEAIGCFPNVCKLKLKEGVVPKDSGARRVPIKVKDKFKFKLEELVKKEIITPMDEPSEWVITIW